MITHLTRLPVPCRCFQLCPHALALGRARGGLAIQQAVAFGLAKLKCISATLARLTPKGLSQARMVRCDMINYTHFVAGPKLFLRGCKSYRHLFRAFDIFLDRVAGSIEIGSIFVERGQTVCRKPPL